MVSELHHLLIKNGGVYYETVRFFSIVLSLGTFMVCFLAQSE